MRPAAHLSLACSLVALAGCGRVTDLSRRRAIAAGQAADGAHDPTAADLLAPPTYARPDRVDELVKRSQPRQTDPFDLPPPTGGAAPPEPAGAEPVANDDPPGEPRRVNGQ